MKNSINIKCHYDENENILDYFIEQYFLLFQTVQREKPTRFDRETIYCSLRVTALEEQVLRRYCPPSPYILLANIMICRRFQVKNERNYHGPTLDRRPVGSDNSFFHHTCSNAFAIQLDFDCFFYFFNSQYQVRPCGRPRVFVYTYFYARRAGNATQKRIRWTCYTRQTLQVFRFRCFTEQSTFFFNLFFFVLTHICIQCVPSTCQLRAALTAMILACIFRFCFICFN